jgi:hypothetical protein
MAPSSPGIAHIALCAVLPCLAAACRYNPDFGDAFTRETGGAQIGDARSLPSDAEIAPQDVASRPPDAGAPTIDTQLDGQDARVDAQDAPPRLPDAAVQPVEAGTDAAVAPRDAPASEVRDAAADIAQEAPLVPDAPPDNQPRDAGVSETACQVNAAMRCTEARPGAYCIDPGKIAQCVEVSGCPVEMSSVCVFPATCQGDFPNATCR